MPSMPHSILSPGCSAATPAGVPVMMMIARAERHLQRQLRDDLRNVPDHLGQIALLLFGAVHRQPDLALRRMADFGGRTQRAAWRGLVEGLADFPGLFLLARGHLQVAAGEVDADAIAVDVIERLVGGNIHPAALQRDDQLDLMLEILRQRRVGDRCAFADDHVRMLGEEERRLTLVVAQFADVLEVVAAHAPDAAHWKRFSLSRDGKGRLRGCGNDEGAGAHGISGWWEGNRRFSGCVPIPKFALFRGTFVCELRN